MKGIDIINIKNNIVKLNILILKIVYININNAIFNNNRNKQKL